MFKNSVPETVIVDMPTPNHEYSYAIPARTTHLHFRPRVHADPNTPGAANIKLSVYEGMSGTQYVTVPEHPAPPEKWHLGGLRQPLTIYFQSSIANGLEIVLLS